MDVRRLYDLLQGIPEDDLDIRLYFTRKKQNGTYISYSPSIAPDLQHELKEIVTNALEKECDTEQREFSPIGSIDGCIETYTTEQVDSFNDIIRSMDEEVVKRDGIEPKEIHRLNFYCVKIHIEDHGDALFF